MTAFGVGVDDDNRSQHNDHVWQRVVSLGDWRRCRFCLAGKASTRLPNSPDDTPKPITCTVCRLTLPDKDFDNLRVVAWRSTHGSYRDAVCRKCFTNRPVPFERQRKQGKFTCLICDTEKDSWLFSTAEFIRHARAGTECELVCLDCLPSNSRHLQMESYVCTCCTKLLPRSAFSDVMQKCRDYKKWRCDTCQRPTCTLCSVQEPTPLNRTKTTGTHICHLCTYSPCTNGCGTLRPDTARRYRVENMLDWMCANCKRMVNRSTAIAHPSRADRRT
jgi:hypothetical protein